MFQNEVKTRTKICQWANFIMFRYSYWCQFTIYWKRWERTWFSQCSVAVSHDLRQMYLDRDWTDHRNVLSGITAIQRM